MQATWVGHSTLLVQLEGLTFLTDPIFSERCRQALGRRRGMLGLVCRGNNVLAGRSSSCSSSCLASC